MKTVSVLIREKAWCLALLMGCSSASYSTTLSQQPLFLTEGAEPNVMFILDDSSSMLSEMMPEKFQTGGLPSYVFPPPAISGIYGTSPSASETFSLNQSHALHRLARSKVNTIYYDPSKFYKPWRPHNLTGVSPAQDIDNDGDTDTGYMALAKPTCAFHNAVIVGPTTAVERGAAHTGDANCRNLTVDHVSSLTYSGTAFTGRNCTGSNGSSATGCSTTATGQTVLFSTAAPTAASGSNGNVHINTATGAMWVKYSGTWRKLTLATSAPTSTSAYDVWVDTSVTPGVASQRNAANTGWTNISGSLTVLTYYPATYYRFSGTDTVLDSTATGVFNTNNYTKVEIRAGNTFSGDGRTSTTRPDCADVSGTWTCAYDQEIQNFANWYTYYRSRVLLSRGAVGTAFYDQTDNIRVGYATLNKTSAAVNADDLTGAALTAATTTGIVKGVRKYTGAEKTKFLQELYGGAIPYSGAGNTGYTYLRRALNDAGKYYSRTDNRGPWGSDPENGSTGTHLNCRASYSILTTDGYWNQSDSVSAGNADGSAGVTITNHMGGSDYTYSPALPFTDNYSETLADIAMKYWKTDLRTDLLNKVKSKTGAVDTAFWQHMTTFGIGLGVDGTIAYPFENGTDRWTVADVIKDPSKLPSGFTWGTLDLNANATAVRPEKIDDLLHAAVNGHGDFFSAKDPDQFTETLKNTLRSILDRETNNASAAAANSTSLNQDSVVYQALFSSTNWTGELVAKRLNTDGSFASTNLWSASIPTTGRKVFSFIDGTGVVLNWDNIPGFQAALQGGDAGTAGEDRLDWFLGDDSKAGATYDIRSRTFTVTEDDEEVSKLILLGDIVNSDPAFAGRNNSRFDRLDAALGGGSTYTTYYNDHKKDRRDIIYVGANDGMLHAFNATIDTDDTVVDGAEVFAFTPSSVLPKIESLASRTYGETANQHQYLVDGPIHISDAYVDLDTDATEDPAWRNLLVGTLGAGGRGIYVLDVTDPDNFSAANVLFELDGTDYPELGNITGMAIIAPGTDKRWKIFLGNGYNSSDSGVEKAYFGVIDIEDEYKKARNPSHVSRTKFIALSPSTTGNALAQPALLPNAAGMITAAYAGDLYGNLWKISMPTTFSDPDDPETADTSGWGVAYSGNPLFVARDGLGAVQPITSSPTLGFNTMKVPAALMVYFGTGKYVADTDIANTQVQTFYAIADKSYSTALVRANLHVKSFNLIDSNTRREIINQTVDWTTSNGWYFDFSAGERSITKPLLLYDRLLFPTIIPSTDPCLAGGSGWLLELKAVGEDPNFSLLGEHGNLLLDVPVYGRLSSVEGAATMGMGPTSAASASSAVSSSIGSSIAGENCPRGVSATVALIAVKADGTQQSATGATNTCDLGRQSWRQLQ